MKDIETFVKWIGIIVLCLVIYALPILTTVSICEGWLEDISVILVVCCCVEFMFLITFIERKIS